MAADTPTEVESAADVWDELLRYVTPDEPGTMTVDDAGAVRRLTEWRAAMRQAALREAREALPRLVHQWPETGETDPESDYNDGIEACRRVLDRLIADTEREGA